jgi:hypothetical protein
MFDAFVLPLRHRQLLLTIRIVLGTESFLAALSTAGPWD